MQKNEPQKDLKGDGLKSFTRLFVTGFGSGLLPKAPGTYGSVVGLLIVLALVQFSWPVYFIFTLVFCSLSLWLVSLYLQDSVSKDPKEVVADEILGVLISFLLVPLNFYTILIGFLSFRILDILKPPPISFFDRKVPGAAGVMADDVVAGFLVNMLFHFLILPNF
jgi:phosphatidylglycerophosphatase A